VTIRGWTFVDCLFLLDSTAGEQAIAIAELFLAADPLEPETGLSWRQEPANVAVISNVRNI
jgi:hypothetical protein